MSMTTNSGVSKKTLMPSVFIMYVKILNALASSVKQEKVKKHKWLLQNRSIMMLHDNGVGRPLMEQLYSPNGCYAVQCVYTIENSLH